MRIQKNRRILRTKKQEVRRGCRKLHNEDLHNFCSTPNTNMVIKLRRNRWAWNVVRMGYEKCIQNFSRKREEPLGRVFDGKMILECILNKEGKKVWTGCIWFRIGTNGGLL
jgi:hypothetical protein